MDIDGNLSYNKNTVRSGNFLASLVRFGKETMHRMRKRNRFGGGRSAGPDRWKITGRGMYVSALVVCLLLCGCTRREQLVLETENTLQPVSEPLPPSEERAVPTQEESAAKTSVLEGRVAPAQEESAAQQSAAGRQEESGEPSAFSGTICVHVCGAVVMPAVYELPAGSRVYEAVEAAGGFTEEADESYVNQAEALMDGTKLVIPTTAQTGDMTSQDGQTLLGVIQPVQTWQDAAEGTEAGTAPASSDKININTATEAQLCNIPGIGATRAAAIAAYRQEQGGFARIEDIMNVNGIKEGTYAKIKDSITVN